MTNFFVMICHTLQKVIMKLINNTGNNEKLSLPFKIDFTSEKLCTPKFLLDSYYPKKYIHCTHTIILPIYIPRYVQNLKYINIQSICY